MHAGQHGRPDGAAPLLVPRARREPRRDDPESHGPRPLRVEHAVVGFRRVLSVAGEVDAATAPAFAAALNEVLRAPAREVWIDLGALTFMDSAGVHALLAVRPLFADGRRVALIVPPGPARRTLEVAGVTGEFPLFPDRATAHRQS